MNRPNWYSDERPSGRFQIPPPTLWSGTQQLLAVLVLVYLLQLTLSVGEYLQLDVAKLTNPLQWYRLLTYSLCHAERSPSHLFFNALTIWFFGNPVESELGSRRSYFTFCGLASLVSALTWLAVELVRGGATPFLVGASGIGFAMIVAFAAFDPQRQVVLIILPLRAWVLALIVMLFAVFGALDSHDNVAHAAHLGGGVFGYLAVRYRGRFQDLVDDFERKRATAAREHEIETRREVDRILDKINETGINSLTKAERRFLETASRELQKRR